MRPGGGAGWGGQVGGRVAADGFMVDPPASRKLCSTGRVLVSAATPLDAGRGIEEPRCPDQGSHNWDGGGPRPRLRLSRSHREETQTGTLQAQEAGQRLIRAGLSLCAKQSPARSWQEVPPSSLSTVKVAHSTRHTALSPQHPALSTQHSAHSPESSAPSTRHPAHNGPEPAPQAAALTLLKRLAWKRWPLARYSFLHLLAPRR